MYIRDRIKVLAMYLPQFHRIKENDVWWGEGYTEWTAVKQASSLFDGHDQPKIPLDDNYYDLSDPDVIRWQAKLAKEYLIDGFVFYHYWFGNGRKVLEKPAELLLENKDIDIKFCFCWDPFSWKRTWSKIRGNAWAPKFDNAVADREHNEVLIRQDYGDETAWINHIDYLIHFFKDERYIRIDNKPVFCFISTSDIACITDMISAWRERVRQQGIEDIYIISGNSNDAEKTDAVMERMRFGKHPLPEYDSVCCYSYDELWEENLRKNSAGSAKTYWHGVVDYDDTPRRGKYGSVYLGATPEKFKKYLSLLIRKSIDSDNPLVFLDAWNEWGEGMHLEPDETQGFRYLEAVYEVMSMNKDELISYTSTNEELIGGIAKTGQSDIAELLEIYRQRYQVMRLWANERLCTNCLNDYLTEKGYDHVAIYGYGVHGRMLRQELLQGTVTVDYVIDQRKNIEAADDILVIHINEEYPPVDLIIVSIIEEYETIRSNIRRKSPISIISLQEVLGAALKSAEMIE